MLFDEGVYQTIEYPLGMQDPLKLKDSKKYTDRLKEYKTKTNNQDAIIVAHGKMGGMNVVIAAFDFDFMGGSDPDRSRRSIFVGCAPCCFTASTPYRNSLIGWRAYARSILSLMQLPRSVIAVQEVKEAGLPYLVLLADPVTGGVSASFAMLGDIALSEPGANHWFCRTPCD